MTAGEFGPILLQDFHLIDKIGHFDRERIPERVVHAKGGGAHGHFGEFFISSALLPTLYADDEQCQCLGS